MGRTFYKDPDSGVGGSVGTPTATPTSPGAGTAFLDPAYFPQGGAFNYGDEGVTWPGMEGSTFEAPWNEEKKVINAPTGGAYGAYSQLAESGPTPQELAAASTLAQVNPYEGISPAYEAYTRMLDEEYASNGPEGWMIGKARELAENPGYSDAQKADISNQTASALQSQIAASKDEMYRRAARSGNPMATYNAMANAGQGSSAAMASAERANRIAYADKAKADEWNVMSQIAPQAAQLQLARREAGAAGVAGTAAQGFAQGTGYANAWNQLGAGTTARQTAGAGGLAQLYSQDSQNTNQYYDMLSRLMGTPVASTTSGAKTGG